MFPYLFCFGLTGLLAFLVGEQYIEKSLPKRVLLTLIVCLPVVLLAGVRDYSIGTDVLVYGQNSFDLAQLYPLTAYVDLTIDDYGIGYILLTWVVSNTFESLPVFLGVIELLSIAPVVIACFKLNSKYAWIGIVTFLLMFYGGTLNCLRQGMALGWVLLSTACLLKREYKSCLIAFVVAICLHQTAILALPMCIVCFYFLKGKEYVDGFSRQGKMFVKAIALIVAFLVVAFGQDLVIFFSSVKDSYAAQVSRLGTGGIAPLLTVLLTVYILFIYIHSRCRNCKSDGEIEAYVLLMAVGYILRFLTIWQPQLERVALFYLACCVLVLPLIAIKLKQTDRNLFTVGSIGVAFSYFCLYYVYYGYSEIYPFLMNSAVMQF